MTKGDVAVVGGEIITRVLEPELVSTGGVGSELELTTGGLGVTEGVVPVVGGGITTRELEPELVSTGGGELEETGGSLEDETTGGLEELVITGGIEVVEEELVSENVEVEVEITGGELEVVDGAELLPLELAEVELPEEVLVVTGGGLDVGNELVVAVVLTTFEVLFVVVGTDTDVELVLVL